MKQFNNIRWYTEDNTSYGWTAEQDMNKDEASFEVREVDPGVFAGFVIADPVQCITHDYLTAYEARSALESNN
jgi:hypothetical protein